jgi:hypothetical protein
MYTRKRKNPQFIPCFMAPAYKVYKVAVRHLIPFKLLSNLFLNLVLISNIHVPFKKSLVKHLKICFTFCS